jgi:hypothetical protein
VSGEGGEGKEQQKVVAPGLRALREFYGELVLTAEDEGKLWVKRGILPECSKAVGLKSSRKEN